MAPDPRRGEIWLVELDPTRGSEIKKTRPIVVASSNAINGLPVRIVVPITTFQDKHDKRLWAMALEPTVGNGLLHKSTAMVEQIRCVSLERFVRREGFLPPNILDDMDVAIKLVLDLS